MPQETSLPTQSVTKGGQNLRKMRNFYLKGSGQGTYILFFVALALVGFFGTMSVILFAYVSPDGEVGSYSDFLRLLAEVNPSLVQVSILGALNIAGVYFLSLVISHRTFGPMVRIRKHVKDLIDGNYEARITLRPNDQFQEFAEELNVLSATLQRRAKEAGHARPTEDPK